MHDIPEIAARLVRFDTVSGRGGEEPALTYLASLLEPAGFVCALDHRRDEGAAAVSMRAVLNPEDRRPALAFGGHLDTVPPGGAPWRHPPFAGVVADGFVHGRGSADMKGGIAAMTGAALAAAPRLGSRRLELHYFGGEELGCVGSFHMLAQFSPRANPPAAAIIAEPTGNRPVVGHKGALWFRLKSAGRTAHSSMPEQGINALARLVPIANLLLEGNPAPASHPWLGESTAALTTMHAGANVNSIPDAAEATLDLRTVPGQDHQELIARVRSIAGEAAEAEVLLDLPPVWTDPDQPWCRKVIELASRRLGAAPSAGTVQFFTDAAAFKRHWPELPVVILGPGDPALAHRTDERCSTDSLIAAREIYSEIIADWYGPEAGL